MKKKNIYTYICRNKINGLHKYTQLIHCTIIMTFFIYFVLSVQRKQVNKFAYFFMLGRVALSPISSFHKYLPLFRYDIKPSYIFRSNWYLMFIKYSGMMQLHSAYLLQGKRDWEMVGKENSEKTIFRIRICVYLHRHLFFFLIVCVYILIISFIICMNTYIYLFIFFLRKKVYNMYTIITMSKFDVLT